MIAPSKPIVLLGERALSARFDHVVMDNRGGGRMATEALIDRGARSILVLGGATDEGDSVETLRTRGYLDALDARRLEARAENIIGGGLDISDGYRIVRRLLDEGRDFDGIFALTDSSAMGAIRALHEERRRIPEDVQVIGFDNVKAGRFHTPSLTSVEPGNDEMADAIVDLMVRRLSGSGLGRPKRIMSTASLILRESTR